MYFPYNLYIAELYLDQQEVFLGIALITRTHTQIHTGNSP